jgi:hypothetical protein
LVHLVKSMRFSFFILSTLALLSAASVDASEGGLRVPSLGAVYDSQDGVLRGISGVLGAALIEPGVSPHFKIAHIAISSELRFAVATSEGDGSVWVIRVTGNRTEPQMVADALEGVDSIVLSPSSSAAILRSSKNHRIQVLSGLPDTPVIEGEVSTSSLGDAVADPAVSDDGKEILFPGASLWRIDIGSGAQKIVGGPAAAVSFRERSRDGVAVSKAGDVYRSSSDTALYAGQAAHADPLAVRFSTDAARAYIAFTDGTLVSFTFAASEVKSLSCGCRPSELNRVNADVFRITADPSSPLLFFDASQSDLRLQFVPAAERNSLEAVNEQ